MSKTQQVEKAAAVAPVFFRIKPEVHERLEKVLKHHSGGRNDLARDGLLREIERIEQHIQPVTPAELKAIASFKRVTGDASIVPTLSAAMRDSVLRSKAPVPPSSGLQLSA